MSEWFESSLLDPNSPIGLGKDLFVGLFSSLIGAIVTIAIITPLTARYVRLQSDRSWRSTRLYYVDAFAQQILDIGTNLLTIREKLAFEFGDEDFSSEIVVDMAESVSGLLELSIIKVDNIFNTFNNSAYAFNAECHFLFADVRKTLTQTKAIYASMRGSLPSDAVETIRIDYIMTDRLLIENDEGVVVRGSLFASDVGVAWRKSGRPMDVVGTIDDVTYSDVLRSFKKFAKFACGSRYYGESGAISALRAFHRGNKPTLDDSFDRFERFCATLRAEET